jgi:shikimate kinase
MTGEGRGSNIILVGPMGAGKSAVGWLLARFLGYGFIDLDELTESRENKGINQIFAERGEESFRELEGRALHTLNGIRSHVIATGGGTVVREENWSMLKAMGVIIWVNPPPEEIARRLLSNDEELFKRPLIADLLQQKDRSIRQKLLSERISAIAGNRNAFYRKSDLVVSDTFSTPHATALLIKDSLRHERMLLHTNDHRFFDRWSVL